MSMPRYVDRDNEIVYRAPYLESETFFTGWFIPSTEAALQEVCDEALNRPAGGKVRYKPLFSSVLLALADIKRVSSLDPRDARRGYTPEQDLCMWILCGAYKTQNGVEVLDHLAFYIPYIWVTNAYTMATGRETYGFPKSFAWAEIPKSKDHVDPIWVDALVIPTYQPTTCVSRERLLDLTREPGAPAEHGPLWQAGESAKAMRALFEALILHGGLPHIDWNLVRTLFRDLCGGHLPMVFLKQFRDVTVPDAACYQAIVEANATVTKFEGGGFLSAPWTLDIHQFASVSIADKLALPATVRLEQGFWVNYSFSMDLAKEVWRAGP